VALTALNRNPAVLAWLVLVAATAASWSLGHSHGPHELATVGVIALAFAKVLVVGEHFMELRHAPAVMRWGFATWAAVVCAALIVMYLLGGSVDSGAPAR
jgi:Prokaryotic Cytochrome C oxidase subunit IV